MTIELSYSIAIINFILAVAVFYFARKKDTQESTTQSTEVLVELRTVRRDLGELKGDVQSMRQEWRKDHDTLIGIAREQQAMWKIIDSLRKGDSENEKN